MTLKELIEELGTSVVYSPSYRTRRAQKSMQRSVARFNGGVDPTLEELYVNEFLMRYEQFLWKTNCAQNTVSYYNGLLRTLFYKAVEVGILSDVRHLFKGLCFARASTRKRAVSSQIVEAIIFADLSERPELELYRDIFVFSFYAQGMSFIDVCYLRKDQVHNQVIEYCRSKSKSFIQVPVSDDLRDLIDKYSALTPDSPYLFPMVTLEGEEGRKQYDNALHRMNIALKEIAAHLGIKENLTSYVSRHTWATVAYHNDVPVSVVSQAMGHKTEEVTRIYLASLDVKVLFEANQLVMGAVLAKYKGQGRTVREIAAYRIKHVKIEEVALCAPSKTKKKKSKKHRLGGKAKSSGGFSVKRKKSPTLKQCR